MNIYAAASLFAVLILLYWVIAEVFTVLFRLIGLPEEKARFQVISLLTGTGFTTRESEMILSTRSRRLARITVLFGYVFNITFVSTAMNVFRSAGTVSWGSSALGLLIPLGTLVTVLRLSRTREVRIWLDRKIERAADSFGSNRGVNGVMRIDELGPRPLPESASRRCRRRWWTRPSPSWR